MKEKKPRTDKRRNVGKVAEALAIDPNLTEREIAKKTGVSNGTVHNAKKELEQTGAKDDTINYIVGASKYRLTKVSKIIDAKIKNIVQTKMIEREDGEYDLLEGEQLDNRDLALLKDIAKDDLARITVLGGAVTDDQGGLTLEAVQHMSLHDIHEYINKVL